MNKCIASVLLLLISSSFIIAQTTYYSRNGATAPRNWDEADSWTLNSDGSGAAAAIPGRNDNVVILSGHTIIVDNIADNGPAGVSANSLSLGNVGAFTGSGTNNFYQIGNITIESGGSLSASQRVMFAGSVLVHGTLETTTAGDDMIILGRLEVSSAATLAVSDDLILSGNSETLIFNGTDSSDDLYIDHTDAQLCGTGSFTLGDDVQYFNGASSDQICSDISITCGGTCPATGTGSNGISTDQTLIQAGSAWRYLDDGSNQGTAWRGTGFDDSSWASDQAQLGYGDGDETTTVSFGADPNDKHETTYFRKSFYVADPNDYSSVLLRLLRDDGAVVYINGTEVDRQNMPTGTINFNTLASSAIGGSAEDTFFETTLANTVLTAGTNYIAVEVHQANITSSDISFDLELIGQFGSTLVSKLSTWNYLDDGSNQGTAWRAAAFDDSGWSSGAGVLGYGDSQTTVVSFGGDPNNKHETTYFRHDFTVADASIYQSLTLNLLRDDGAVVYLNGTEILRDNMPTGTITFTTLASSTIGGEDEDNYTSFNVSSASLVDGNNVLAVEIHQRAVDSSDKSFDLELIGVEDNPLPVEWLSFEAFKGNNDAVNLSWSTASEVNNDYFEIERSENGKEFSVIASVEGNGNSSAVSTYQYTDSKPLNGTSYYRLKQVDFDGQYEYSVIRAVNIAAAYFVYPNPADTYLKILGLSDQQIRVRMLDLQGKEVNVVITQEGDEINVDTSGLDRGYYILKLSGSGDFNEVHRVLIAH